MRPVIIAFAVALGGLAVSIEADGTSINTCQPHDWGSFFEVLAGSGYEGETFASLEPRGYEPSGEWKGSKHCLSGFCIYWTRLRDIVLVTKQSKDYSIRDQVSQLSESPLFSLMNKQQEDDMFYESEIPGKGIGLIAKRLIRKGESVMKRQPSLLVQVEAQARTDVHVRDILYGQAMDGMRDIDRNRVMGMMGSDLGDKIDKNCFRLRINDHENNDSGDHYIGCYPDIARLNHDCRPRYVTDAHWALTDFLISSYLSIASYTRSIILRTVSPLYEILTLAKS